MIRWIWILLILGGCGTTVEELQELCRQDEAYCDEAISAEDRRLRKRQREETRQMLMAYCKENGAVLFCEDAVPGTRDYETDCQCAKTRY